MNRLERLIELRDVLEKAIEECDSKRDLAALSRQYRETLKEIEELEGETEHDDEIGSILAQRSNGMPGADSTHSAELYQD